MMKNVLFIFCIYLLSGCDESGTTQGYKNYIEQLNKHYIECKESDDKSEDCRNTIDAHIVIEEFNKESPILS
ncbi:EexN family lipoprotein [Enterobacter wuhouensis]|uniref:EexN family lipoprotein n=1 Tax=Enterobacter wuhouensis TaxID=2529381 RepID=UPI0038996802